MENSTTGGGPAQSMQERLIDAMRSRIETADLAAVIQAAWSNTGTIYAQDADFHTHLEIEFDFQGDYCVLALRGSAVEASNLTSNGRVWSREKARRGQGDEIRFGFLRYSEGVRIRVLLEQISTLLTKPDDTPPAPSAQLLQAAQDAFWAVVADHHRGDATTGDLAPDAEQAFATAASVAVLAWEQANVMPGIRVGR